MDIKTRFLPLWHLWHLWRDGRGATAIEYGLIAGGIALVIIGAVALVGSGLQNTFNDVSNNF